MPSRVFPRFGLATCAAAAFFTLSSSSWLSAGESAFERVQLSDQFFSEGATHGDFNGDGNGDVAIGPWIYWGPEFNRKSRFYAGDAIDPIGYSENFLMYSGDANDDGQRDIYVLGFPGKESWWYENPGAGVDSAEQAEQVWKRHTMLDVVDNESPLMIDIDGDGLDDLVCSSKGHYGYATRAGQDPREMWKFVKISPNNGYHRFTHGLGVGDVNNDGSADLMEKDGWWENPGTGSSQGLWTFHPFEFSAGGSQMFAVDLDGDGRNEVVTGLAAHGYGLVYYRALDPAATKFERVDIMTDDPANSPTGLAVSQLHGVDIGDMNGDGVPDIVTGKRWWAHANGDPGSSQPATLLWLETQRSGGRVQFIPHVIDNSSGVGTQVTVGDVNGDSLLDVVSGNKRGAYLFLQRPADLPAEQALVAGRASQDAFGQRPAMGLVKLDDAQGGFRPALGERPLDLEFTADTANPVSSPDWEARGPMRASAVVDGCLDSGSKQPEAIGEFISRPFRLSEAWLSFDVAGSGNPEARIEVMAEESGRAIATASGSGDKALTRQVFELAAWQGQLVRIRVVDHAKDAYVRGNDFRLHAHAPTESE